MTTGKSFNVGSRIRVARTSSPANYMEGIITAFNSGSGVTTFTSDLIGGSGSSITDWSITLAGEQGIQGIQGDVGATGASGFEWAPTTAGTASALTATFDPAIVAYTAGQPLIFIMHTNCVAGATLNANGIGAKALYLGGAPVEDNALLEDVAYIGVYDGTNLQVLGASSGGGGGGETLVIPVVGAGASQTLNYANGNVFDLTGTASTACTLTLSNPPASGTVGRFRLIWRQPASTGLATLIFPASVKWLGRDPQTSAPSFTTSAGFVHEVDFITVDGGTTYYAEMVGGSTINPPSATAGIYVAACSSGYTLYSTDGITFSKSAQQLSGRDLRVVIQKGGRFHLICSDGIARDLSLNAIYTANGSSFTAWPASSTDNQLPKNILQTTGSVLVYGKDNSNNNTWKSIDNASTVGFQANGSGDFTLHATDGAESFLMIATDSTTTFCAATSFTASNYNPTSGTHTGVGAGLQSAVGYGNSQWLIGTTIGDIYYKATPNATAITKVTSVIGAVPLRGEILWTGTKWVARGDSGKFCNASSIGSWTSRTTGLAGNITGMAYYSGVLMLVTHLGEIARSTDNGDTWTLITGASNPFSGSVLNFIKYRLTKFWIGSTGAKLAQSSDGITFSLVTTSGSETIYDIEAV